LPAWADLGATGSDPSVDRHRPCGAIVAGDVIPGQWPIARRGLDGDGGLGYIPRRGGRIAGRSDHRALKPTDGIPDANFFCFRCKREIRVPSEDGCVGTFGLWNHFVFGARRRHAGRREPRC